MPVGPPRNVRSVQPRETDVPKISGERAFKDQIKFLLNSDQITVKKLREIVTMIEDVITKRELTNGRKSTGCDIGFE